MRSVRVGTAFPAITLGACVVLGPSCFSPPQVTALAEGGAGDSGDLDAPTSSGGSDDSATATDSEGGASSGGSDSQASGDTSTGRDSAAEGSGGCPAGQINCGTGCIDVTTNPANCGSCGTVCGNGVVPGTCTAGYCTRCVYETPGQMTATASYAGMPTAYVHGCPMPPGNGTAQATITFCSNVGGQSGSTGWASPQLDMNLLLQAPTTGTGGTPTFTSTSLATQSMTLYEAVVIPTDGHVVAGIQVTDCYGIASGAGTYCGVIFSSFGSPTQNPTLVFQSSSGTPISSTLCP